MSPAVRQSTLIQDRVAMQIKDDENFILLGLAFRPDHGKNVALYGK
jgi:hypothetical protein